MFIEEYGLLTQDEIIGLAPRGLLEAMVHGIKKKQEFSVSILLDANESDPKLSSGTGKVYIGDGSTTSFICQYLRKTPLAYRCSISDLYGFNLAKEKSEKDPCYPGEKYKCKGLGLWDFTIPIYESDSKTFIGAILGGQWRDKESSRWNSAQLFRDYVRDNSDLAPYERELIKHYRNLPPLDEAGLADKMKSCRCIAKEIADLFGFYIKQKRELREEQDKRLKREANVAKIHKTLIDANNLNQYWKCMQVIADGFWGWLPVDWCLILRQKTDESGHPIPGLEEVGRANGSRGLRQKNEIEHLLEKVGPFTDGVPLDAFSASHVDSMVVIQYQCKIHGSIEERCAMKSFPICEKGDNGDKIVVAFVAMGSAPGHKNASFNFGSFDSVEKRVSEVIRAMGMEYRELVALHNAEQRAKELESKQKELNNQVQFLEDTLMSLNHQLHGPLWMLSGILTNVRDFMQKTAPKTMDAQIEVGVLVAQHGALLCEGMASVLATEQGRARREYIVNEIDVENELTKLAEAMKKSFQCLDRTVDMRLGQSPHIFMTRLDFFLVFYSLLENAIKYAYPDKDIRVECSWQENVGRDCFKVWSIGHSISPSDVEHVFQKFWRHKESWQNNEMGLGLGCWLARECMRRCGGDLYLEVNGAHSVFVVVPPEQGKKGEK
jgi:signal transduction histidine kinase/ligand-binding sensor protein